MASNRHLCRIIALQSIYECDFRDSLGIDGLSTDTDEVLRRNIEVYRDAVDESEFIIDLVKGTFKNLDLLDKMIIPAAPEWPIDQIAKIDKSILRMSLYELLIKKDVPPKVVINGVLGTIFRQSELYDPREDKRIGQVDASQNDSSKSTKK